MNSIETITDDPTLRPDCSVNANVVIAQLEQGTMVRHYEIGERIGETAAYTAQNSRTGEPVVVKMSPEDSPVNGLLAETILHRQSQGNDHIVNVDGHGFWRGRPFLATLRQEGGTLATEFSASEATTRAKITGVIELLDQEVALIDEGLHRSVNADVQDVKSRLTVESRIHLADEIEESSALDVDTALHVVAQVAHESGQEIEPDSLVAKELARQLLFEITHEVPALPDREEILRRFNILYGISDAAAYLNSRGIVHRDLKKANTGIDLTGQTARVFDLGIATRQKVTQPNKILGTLGRIPPEGYSGLITPQHDSYALGKIAYELLTGIEPHRWDHAQDVRTNLERIYNDQPPEHPTNVNSKITRSEGDMVMSLLKWDYRQRGTTEQARDSFGQAIAA